MQGAGGIGGLLALTNASGNSYSYFTDGNGNVVDLADDYGTSAAHYEYDPFGNLVAQTGTLQQNYQWSSKENDGNGLAYYLYRFDNPSLGRWTNRDPMGEAGGLNLTEFAVNSAINEYDLFGLDSGNATTPDQLFNDFYHGTNNPVQNFTDGDEVVEEIKKGFLGETIRNEMLDYGRDYCKNGNPKNKIPLGSELASIPWYEYPVYFFHWRYSNPATAFVGSFTRGEINITGVRCCTCRRVWATVHAVNIAGFASATRLPPPLGGYNGHPSLEDNIKNANPFPTPVNLFPFSTLFSDNPFGSGQRFNTLTQNFDFHMYATDCWDDDPDDQEVPHQPAIY